jgi:hypothetical protein
MMFFVRDSLMHIVYNYQPIAHLFHKVRMGYVKRINRL